MVMVRGLLLLLACVTIVAVFLLVAGYNLVTVSGIDAQSELITALGKMTSCKGIR